MATSKINKIVLIGAGNVGSHLGKAFFQQGIHISQVFSRKKRKAQRLAKQLGAKAINDLTAVQPDADLYLIAVHDNAIAAVAASLSSINFPSKTLFVHSSGATPSTVLKPYFKHYGVFYPLQSFTSNINIDFKQTPLCIDAKYVRDRKSLVALAETISDSVYLINDDQRATLHVAAVFGNNFTNLMYQHAAAIAKAKNLPFALLQPILMTTAQKVQLAEPEEVQTGPAIRKDDNTLLAHLSYLKTHHPDLYPVYLQLTKQIYPGFEETAPPS